MAVEFGVVPLDQLPGRAGVAVRQAPCQRIFAPHVFRTLKFGFHTHTTRQGRGKFRAAEENVSTSGCFEGLGVSRTSWVLAALQNRSLRPNGAEGSATA